MRHKTSFFHILGFKVKIDISWILLTLLISWTLSVALFPKQYPNQTIMVYWGMGVISAIGVFISVVLHEYAHALLSRHYNIEIQGITLHIFGGVAESQNQALTPKSEFIIAIAGPVTNFILAFIFYRIYLTGNYLSLSPAVQGINLYLSYINIIIASFNLVPALPLDGGRMLRAMIWQYNKNIKLATKLTHFTGTFAALTIIIYGVIEFVQGFVIAGIGWLLVGFYLRGSATTAYRHYLIKHSLALLPVSQLMISDPVSIPADLTVKQAVDKYLSQSDHELYPVLKNNRLLGYIDQNTIQHLAQKDWQNYTVEAITVRCNDNNTISSDNYCIKLLPNAFTEHQRNTFIVVENNQLVGTISLTDIGLYLKNKLADQLKQ